MYKFFEHLKDCYYEIKAMSFKSRLNFDLSFWKYLFLRGMTVARIKLKLAKVEEAKSWNWKSWVCQKLKKWKVENWLSWKC